MTTVQQMLKDAQWLIPIANFLRAIGIEVHWREVSASTSGDAVRTERGRILIQRHIGPWELLLAAGRLAVVPKCMWLQTYGKASDARGAGFRVVRSRGLDLEIDHPFFLALIQAGEEEATAWAWAAGRHLGIQGATLITDDMEEGEGALARDVLARGTHPGVNGLRAARLCQGPRDAGGYPIMEKWIQDAEPPLCAPSAPCQRPLASAG